MKIYAFGAENAPVILLLPGTCCHWKGNFGKVIPLLADSFRVLCVSYDGFDETESTEFPTMLEETEKIEAYLREHGGGHIRAAYGCSLGGSFVGLLAARQNISMDYGILGSSDLDQASPLAAKLQTNLLVPLIYPLLRDGQFKSRFLQKSLQKREKEMGEYVKIFLWTCLLIVPGFIAAIRYSMAPYLLAEHPDWTAKEALEESKRIMKGRKGQYFLLLLSFIGWTLASNLLQISLMSINGVVAIVAGLFVSCWVNTYVNASVAVFYKVVSEEGGEQKAQQDWERIVRSMQNGNPFSGSPWDGPNDDNDSDDQDDGDSLN